MKSVNAILITAIFSFQLSAWSQNSATDQLQQMQENTVRQGELNAEDLRRLEEERSRLGQRLAETTERITQLQNQSSPANLITSIDVAEIAHHMENKTFGGCRLAAGEQLGEYFIERDGIKIRFVFLSKGNTLEPKASIKRSDAGETILEIFQPGYDANDINKVGPITATLRFQFPNNTVRSVVHAVFTGQRIEDRLFGYRSSFETTNITCVL